MAYYLGVDQGTTYSAAAVCRQGRVDIAALGGRDPDIPSIVFLKEDDTILVGDAAGRRGASDPARMVREFKRRFGDPAPYILGGSPIAADALWAKLLAWVLETICKAEGGPPDGVAITHPANWGPYKLDLLAQAIRLADVPNPVTLTEPEAAAISYAAANRVEEGEVVGVYDLGGGTFDAAVIRRTTAGFELIGRPEGIERLGGLDVDEAVLAHVNQIAGDALAQMDPEDAAAISAMTRLRRECTIAKELLSQDTEVTIPVVLPGISTEVRLTRSELEAMIRPTLIPTVEALGRAVKSAGLEPNDLSVVLLVGGSSRIPLVGQMVGASLRVPVVTDAHPKHSVASGAAIFAERVASTRSAPAAVAKPVPLPAQKAVGAASQTEASPKAAPVPAPRAPVAAVPPAAPVHQKGRHRTLPKWAWQTIAMVLVGAALLTGLALRNRGSGSGDIALLAADSPGPNPFTERGVSTVATNFDPDATVVVSQASAAGPEVAAPKLGASIVRSDGITTFRGGTPGLFGDIRDSPSCLREVVESSATTSNAFAQALELSPSEVAGFLGDLTPVVLRGDTRVTSHSLSGEKAQAQQVVLQAGTAVLVDSLGIPRVRCLSGSPLKPPVAGGSTRYTAQSWPDGRSLAPSGIVPNDSPLYSFVLIDQKSGVSFDRAAGRGGQDADHRSG